MGSLLRKRTARSSTNRVEDSPKLNLKSMPLSTLQLASKTNEVTSGSFSLTGISSNQTAISNQKHATPNHKDEARPHSHQSFVGSDIDEISVIHHTASKIKSSTRKSRNTINSEYIENNDFETKHSPSSLLCPVADSRNLVDITTALLDEISHINVAVIGSTGVGKTTLIQRALGLKEPPICQVSKLELSVDNVIYAVNLIELNFQSIEIDSERRLSWPLLDNSHTISGIDGVLLLYDVTSKESIKKFPAILNGLVNSLLPTVLVSCKCDLQEHLRHIDPNTMQKLCFSCVDAVKVDANVPETAQHSLDTVIRAIKRNNFDAPISCKPTVIPSYIPESTQSTVSQSISASRCQHVKHDNRDSTNSFECSITGSSLSITSPPSSCSLNYPTQNSLSSSTSWTSFQQIQTKVQNEAVETLRVPICSNSCVDNSVNSTKKHVHDVPKHPDSTFLETHFSDIGLSLNYSKDFPLSHEECVSDSLCTDDNLVLLRDDRNFLDKNPVRIGLTLDELVDRLTGQCMSRDDKDFIDIFLCLYRKFAAPGKLLSDMLARLESLTNDGNMHILTKAENQFRILNIITKWISTYPGDFAGPSTSQRLDNFINDLYEEPRFVSVAHRIRLLFLTQVAVNEDTGWAKTDLDFDIKTGPCIGSNKTISIESKSQVMLEPEYSIHSSFDQCGSGLTGVKRYRADIWGRPATSFRPLQSIEDYDREAETMIPKTTLPLSKFRFYIFMQIPDEDLSDEITRIDWVMFSTIRLRGLVRHVSLSPAQKQKWKDLRHINRMITHFNHIANWVATLILMRDKAKHRAMMLKKFINIALRLRQLNNYNGLAAVLAGLNGIAIYRLTQTWCLLPAEVNKRFLRLMMLMGVQRSHASYRMAWKNTKSFRIPFLPLHRRDLITAEESSCTFLDPKEEYINWKKFRVLSDIILPLMKSQMEPFPNLKKSKGLRELILDCKIINDEEELYKRSLVVESNASSNVDFGKKKFSWFQKPS